MNSCVTLGVSGSALGGGLVSIFNGVGTRFINDTVAETVTLSLTDTQGTGLDVSSTQGVVFSPGAATRIVILDPTDGMVNNPITVTLQAQDIYGNVATGVNSGVTLGVSGLATGGGLVSIVNGIGTAVINDPVAETVILRLTDTEGTGLNVLSIQNVVFSEASFIDVASPNGGESWGIDSKKRINWTSSGLSGKVKIQLSTTNGDSWIDIVTDADNDGTERWTVKGPGTSLARIRVCSVDGSGVCDASDANFTIQEQQKGKKR